jgi:hypothetical protein
MISNLVHMAHFWDNLHQVHLDPRDRYLYNRNVSLMFGSSLLLYVL